MTCANNSAPERSGNRHDTPEMPEMYGRKYTQPKLFHKDLRRHAGWCDLLPRVTGKDSVLGTERASLPEWHARGW
jgi:hypothetical protein